MPGQPLLPSDEVPKRIRDLLVRARTSWLKNEHVYDILTNYQEYNLQPARDAPRKPPGGTLFLFNRRTVRFFRKDGHAWRKKVDGKTVRETHEKLKVNNQDMLNCYYAHAEEKHSLQRRCYWLLDTDDSTVLVHYLSATPAHAQPFPPPRALSAPLAPPPAPQAIGHVYAAAPTSLELSRLASRGVEAEEAVSDQPIQIGVVVTTGAEPFELDAVPVTNHPAGAAPEAPSPFARPEQGMPQWGGLEAMPDLPAPPSPLPGPEQTSPQPLQRAGSSRVVLEGATRLGPLHTAPSFEGPTVQTGETTDALTLALQRQASGAGLSAPSLTRRSSVGLDTSLAHLGFEHRPSSIARQASTAFGSVDVLGGYAAPAHLAAAVMDEDPRVVVTLSRAPTLPQADNDADAGGDVVAGLTRANSLARPPRPGLRSASTRLTRSQDGLLVGEAAMPALDEFE